METNPYGFASRFLFSAVGFLLATAFSAVPASAEVEVVSHWRLGEEATAGTLPKRVASTVGEAPLGVSGTVTTDTASPDARGSKSALKFDGKTAYLKGKAALEVSDNFCAEAFVKSDTEDGFHVIVQQGSAAHGWSLVRNGKAYQAVLGGVQLVGWSGEIPAGKWCHVAIVRIGGVTKLYVDGQERGQAKDVIHPAGKGSLFSIGAGSDGTSNLFAGTIDEVRVSKLVGGAFNPADLLINQADVSVDPKPQAAGGGGAGAAAKGGDKSPEKAGPAVSVKFDESPVETGITFRRDNMRPTNMGGRDGWVAGAGSAPGVPWARSVLLKVTDPKFRSGNMPVCDVEIDFLQTFNSPVELRVDTERGSAIVGGSWGNSPEWKTFRVSLDDAVFGARQHQSKQTDMNTDGYDLRVNSFGGDFVIGAVRIIGYDMEKDPDYRRLLRLESVDCAGGIFALEPGKAHKVTYKFRNLARKAMPAKYDIEFKNRAGDLISRTTKEITFAGRERVEVPFQIDATSLPKGVYDLRITVYQTDKPQSPVVVSYEGYVAITDNDTLPKARQGEFLYGLDVKQGASHDDVNLLKWADLMGADIIRHGFGGEDDVGNITANLPKFTRRGLSVMLICDPPKETDPGARAGKLAAKVAYLEAIAKTFPQIRFYELGNEPDLRFFYPGEIKDYAADLAEMSKAVKRKNPSAFVMNGGLSFAGAEGTERSKEFVRLADPQSVDGWAYHGHGVGMEAEKAAWERMDAVVKSFGKAGKPLVETESGMAARTRSQEDTQARTVVQKMVYAQSKKMPLFMWFRLLMFEEDYGSLRNDKEPRPAILAYRTMVKTLRGMKFDRELTGLPSGAQGFAFTDAAGKRACVLWSDSPQPRTLLLMLAGNDKALTLRDIYGNDAEVAVQNGSAKVIVGQTPVFLTAKAAAADAQFSLLPAMLDGPSAPVLIRGTDGTLDVTVRNPLTTPLKAELRVTTPTGSTVTVVQASYPVTLGPGASSKLAIPVRVANDPAAVRWPTQWHVYAGATLPADPAAITDVPDALPGSGKTITGVKMAPEGDRIDFEKAGGVMGERNPGLVIGIVESATEQTVRVGASADWWMAWYVNGKKVFDTLETGNGAGSSITDHVFDLPLKKGRNVVMVQVLSGSQGWKLVIGDPVAIRKATATAVDVVDLSMTNDQNVVMDRQRIEPQLRLPLVAPAVAWPGSPADWDGLDPDLDLGEASIRNEFAKEPDSSKWWKGPADLSARVWLRADAGRLLVAVAVRDDVAQAGPTGDRLRLMLDGGREVVLTSSDATRRDDMTWYFAAVPRSGKGPRGTLKVVVDDVDVPGTIKQTAEAGPYLFGWPGAK